MPRPLHPAGTFPPGREADLSQEVRKTMVRRRILLVLAVLGLCTAASLAAEMVGVEGSTTQFPGTIESPINHKQVKLVLTGTALRTRYFFSVYSIGSYVEQGHGIHSAEDLAGADVPKQLHLVMERDVDGKTMATAFREAVRLNYPAPAFDADLDKLSEVLQALSLRKGDHVWLSHVPGLGFHARLAGQREMLIPNARFSRAIWEIYLGKNNLGEPIKEGLLSRL
jgi:hypothetical protein